MNDCVEYIEFSYCFSDKEDGIKHQIRSSRRKESVRADELCEMFLDFMRSAGYSENNVWDFFKQN